MLTHINGLKNMIAMSDFNFEPATEQYALMTHTLDDSWLLKWPQGKEMPGFSSKERIDHIFVSPGFTLLESEYKVSSDSDHPYMYTVFGP